jgi:hypothetical protein
LQSALNAKVPYTGATANVNLGTHTLSSYNLVVNHASGSGVAAQITKGGNGEALTVVKSSGSGNAASITGGTTLLSTLNLTNALADSFIASAATWNAKQNALNGTGFVKISGTTISYDNNTYALDSAVVKLTGDQSITGGKSFTTNTASPTVVVTNNSTGSGLLLQNTSTGIGATSNNVSTGIGIRSVNSSTGEGIRSNNTAGGTGFYSLNTSTGRGIWSANTGTYGIYSENAGAGDGIYSQNSSTGSAFSSWNSSTGIGIYSNNTSSGRNLVLNNTTSATGMTFTIQKQSTDVFTINDAGEATGVKFIKSGGTSSQYLMADGSVSTLTNPITGTGTTNFLPKFTGASSLGNSQIFDNGTNVGIGTTSPSDKLSVSGAIRLIRTDDTAQYSTIQSDSNGSFRAFAYRPYAGAGNYGDFRFVGGDSTGASATLMYINTNGNVGIGTTTPIAKLQVDGTNYSFIAGSEAGNRRVNIGLDSSGEPSIQGTLSNGTARQISINPSGGNVGIGTTTPERTLHVLGQTGIGTVLKLEGATGTTTYLQLSYNGATNSQSGYIGYDSSSNMSLFTNDTERMRITSGGDVLVGKSTDARNVGGVIIFKTGNGSGRADFVKTASGASSAVANYHNGTYVGGIDYSDTSSSFLTSSDYRLKQDLKPINGLDLVSQIKVYDYEWKSDETRAYGVLAHELQEVIPQAVNGEKDAEQMQGVDYSKLVPILVQAIQELKAEIEILKNK